MMRDLFYTLGTFFLLLILLSLFSKACKESEKEEKTAMAHCFVKAKEKSKFSEWERKFMGENEYSITIQDTGFLYDEKSIAVSKKAFDTLKVNYKLNYNSFSKIAKTDADREKPFGWIWKIFTFATGMFIFGFLIQQAYLKFR